jgi:hypothetical protein
MYVCNCRCREDAIEFYSKNNFRFLSEDDLEKDTMQMYRCLL